MTSAAAIRAFLGGPLRTATFAVVVLAMVAFVFAGWFGLSWYRAAHDGSLAQRMARDAVLQDAQQATVNLSTINFRQVQDGLRLWEQSAAGSLSGQLRESRDTAARAITDARTNTSARVLDGAVAALDERSGTAQVLVGVDVMSLPEGAEASCVSRRLRLEMRREGGVWKVENLTPVGEANSMPGACPAPKSAPSK